MGHQREPCFCAKVQPIGNEPVSGCREQDRHTKISCTFLYAGNEQPKNEVKKTILFTVAQKEITYLGINLTKENYKMLEESKDLNGKIPRNITQYVFSFV